MTEDEVDLLQVRQGVGGAAGGCGDRVRADQPPGAGDPAQAERQALPQVQDGGQPGHGGDHGHGSGLLPVEGKVHKVQLVQVSKIYPHEK